MGDSTVTVMNDTPSANGSQKEWQRYYESRLRGIETLLEERDRRYDERFRAQLSAVDAAFAAQKQLTNAILAASEKAIEKAEAAQAAHNASSNEFRGTLKDQNDTMMPRKEAEGKFMALLDKVDDLKEARNKGEGRTAERVDVRAQANWSIGHTITVIFAVLSSILAVGSLIVALTR